MYVSPTVIDIDGGYSGVLGCFLERLGLALGLL